METSNESELFVLEVIRTDTGELIWNTSIGSFENSFEKSNVEVMKFPIQFIQSFQIQAGLMNSAFQVAYYLRTNIFKLQLFCQPTRFMGLVKMFILV